MNNPFGTVKKLSQFGQVPTKGSPNSAGFDLYSAHDVIIPAIGKELVFTDISMEFPVGYYGRIAPRSGLAKKHFLDIGAGVIDPDYTGNIGILLFNFGTEIYSIKRGDRIAQLIFEKYGENIELLEILNIEETERGDDGFTFTGV